MNHEQYIKRCLEIAQKGIGSTRPNPSAGAVLVVDNQIIGEGFTGPYGDNHAEVNAIESVRDISLLEKATIYVTLEPCSHFGNTPPCSDLIIKSGIKKVIIGCVDSSSKVSGKGIERLKKAGCEVIVGVLEKECLEHHRRFFTFHNKKRPYIILKWAETKDGYIAPLFKDEKKPVWITNKSSQQVVHQWRAQEHGILVGTNTVLEDNPKLNVRYCEGDNPVRIVIDRMLKIPRGLHVHDQSVKTIFIYGNEINCRFERSKELVFEPINFLKPIASQICKILHKHQIQSIIVEGGAKTLQAFINENIWDEARVFIGDISFENGVKSPEFPRDHHSEHTYEGDVLKKYKND